MTEPFIVSLLRDRYQRIIDRWVDRLVDHEESRYDQLSTGRLKTICERGLGASFAYLKGFEDPSLEGYVRKLIREKDQLGLETIDVLRLFWEFRSTLIEVADVGGDAGTRDWKSFSQQLDGIVEAVVIYVVETIEK